VIGYRPLWCGFRTIREGRQRGCWVRGRRRCAYSSVAGGANICRSQMNIGGLDVVAVGNRTQDSAARVGGVSARMRIWVGSRVSEKASEPLGDAGGRCEWKCSWMEVRMVVRLE
jgi:hypothetical protein